MLVLRRKLNEEIQIGTDVRVKVIGIAEKAVKIGIIAPDEVRIFVVKDTDTCAGNATILTSKTSKKLMSERASDSNVRIVKSSSATS